MDLLRPEFPEMNPVQGRRIPEGAPRERPRLRPVPRRQRLLPVPVHRRWKGDRVRLVRWRRTWVVLLALLLASPMVALLPPVQRLFFPLRFEAEIGHAARSAGIDPYLLAAVAFRESSFRPQAVSDQGAVGLMQLLPSTAEWAAGKAGRPWEGAGSLRRPEVSLGLGAWYLGWLLDRFDGDPVLALAAYNGGQHTVDRWRGQKGSTMAVEDLPYPETRCFVAKVLQAREQYKSLYPDLGP